MKIQVENISKRFKKEWIFKSLSYTFSIGKTYALTGSNGSGKSTLIKILSAQDHANSGTISYLLEDKKVPIYDFNNHYTFCAPYQELILEMKLSEFLNFHLSMAKEHFSIPELLEIVNLTGNENKVLNNFSSGMIQRLKLGICFFSNRPVLFLDEPTSNLDEAGKAVFKSLINKNKQDKLIIMASNEPFEIDLCDEQLAVVDFKS